MRRATMGIVLVLAALVWAGGLVRALSLSRWCELSVDRLARVVGAIVPTSDGLDGRNVRKFRYDATDLMPGVARLVPVYEYERVPEQCTFGETVRVLFTEGGGFGERLPGVSTRFFPFGLAVPSVHLGDGLVWLLLGHIACCALISRMVWARLKNGLNLDDGRPAFLRLNEFVLWTSPAWLLAVGVLRPSVDVWYSIVQATEGRARVDLGIADVAGPCCVVMVYLIAIVVIGMWLSNRWVRRHPMLAWRVNSLDEGAGVRGARSVWRYSCWCCGYQVSESEASGRSLPGVKTRILAGAGSHGNSVAEKVSVTLCSECGQINPSAFPQWAIPSVWFIPRIKLRMGLLVLGGAAMVVWALPIILGLLRSSAPMLDR